MLFDIKYDLPAVTIANGTFRCRHPGIAFHSTGHAECSPSRGPIEQPRDKHQNLARNVTRLSSGLETHLVRSSNLVCVERADLLAFKRQPNANRVE